MSSSAAVPSQWCVVRLDSSLGLYVRGGREMGRGGVQEEGSCSHWDAMKGSASADVQCCVLTCGRQLMRCTGQLYTCPPSLPGF